MATAAIYCTHKELKRVFPQLDSFDNKKSIYGWTEVSSNKYAAHNSGIVTQLFADGEDLGPAQSAHTDLNGPANAEFVASLNYDSAHSGGVNETASEENTIKEISARSMNSKIDAEVEVLGFV